MSASVSETADSTSAGTREASAGKTPLVMGTRAAGISGPPEPSRQADPSAAMMALSSNGAVTMSPSLTDVPETMAASSLGVATTMPVSSTAALGTVAPPSTGAASTVPPSSTYRAGTIAPSPTGVALRMPVSSAPASADVAGAMAPPRIFLVDGYQRIRQQPVPMSLSHLTLDGERPMDSREAVASAHC